MASVNAVELPVAEVWNHRRTHCEPLNYSSVINYERCYIQKKARNCVMCGRDDTTIPRQNKDVCKACDSSIWLIQNMDLVVKFCKGCKNFLCIVEFETKPESSKCSKCRCRGRQNYFARKSKLTSACEEDGDDEEQEGNTSIEISESFTTVSSTPANKDISLQSFSSSFDSSFSYEMENDDAMTPTDIMAVERMDSFGRVFNFNKMARKNSSERSMSISPEPLLMTMSNPISPIAHTSDLNFPIASSEHEMDSCSRGWEYNPSTNPLMHLAMLTEKLFHE